MCCLINLRAELLKAVCSVLFLLQHFLVDVLYIVVIVVVTVAVFATMSGVLLSAFVTLGKVETEIGEECFSQC